MKIELHCHTRISDGSSTFMEILELAMEQRVTHIAITNHDTTKDLKEMMEIGKASGIEIIPSIEISGYDFKRNRKVHILGYFIEPDHKALHHLCDPFAQKRHSASREMVYRLIEAGYRITWDRCLAIAEGSTGVFKQHIMLALMEAGYTESIYGELYKKLFNRGGNGEQPGLALIPIEYIDAHLAVKAIINAGGVPVLAHPGQYGNFEIVPELVELGLQGIEVWHPLHTKDDELTAIQSAKQYRLIMTGGSDFHGTYGEHAVLLGSKSPGIECLNALKARKEKLLKLIV
ncbi:PHP domain-containing protein [Bacillus sp. Bva_UNVM-123]|uniref:PHP domain-containing protein n=1 Tax=Bacillus sp. Bva_UNVM-123 TaxID=2829798 RepID=UPI00391F8810